MLLRRPRRRNAQSPSFRLTAEGTLTPAVRQMPSNAPLCTLLGVDDAELIERLGEGASPPKALPRAACNKLFPLAFIRALQMHSLPSSNAPAAAEYHRPWLRAVRRRRGGAIDCAASPAKALPDAERPSRLRNGSLFL